MAKIVIIMGSKRDLEYAKSVEKVCEEFKIPCEMRVASSHKTPEKVMSIIKEYEDETVVYITIAGRSNALSGVIDGNTAKPVIASPPYSEKFGGADIFSTLRMPSGVAPMVVLGGEQSALAAIKILALHDEKIQQKLTAYQKKFKEKIERDDRELRDG
jgi:5-(carboxyamino)imidazole ribonucleotide mutase